jgi:hypothetical protein
VEVRTRFTPNKETNMSITVDIKWDPGDMSAGLRPGWDPEQCVLIHEVDGMRYLYSFEIVDDLSVGEWEVWQIDVLMATNPNAPRPYLNIGYCADPRFWEVGALKRNLYVRDLPEVFGDAITTKWREIMSRDEEPLLDA